VPTQVSAIRCAVDRVRGSWANKLIANNKFPSGEKNTKPATIGVSIFGKYWARNIWCPRKSLSRFS
jgi:hypothetical protein